LDNLQHIDDLLKRASQEPANAFVNDSDWDIIEKKLERRKIRIYAIWVFLALVVASTSLFILNSSRTSQNKQRVVNTESSQTDYIHTTNKTEILASDDYTLSEEVTETENAGDIKRSSEYKQPTVEMNNQSSENIVDQSSHQQEVSNTSNQFMPSSFKELFSSKTLVQRSTPNFSVNLEYTPTVLVKLSRLDRTASAIEQAINKKTASNYFEIGYSFTPSISSKMLGENSSLSGLINKDYYDKVAANESSAFASSTGINIQYHTKTPFYVSSGLYMTQRTESVDYNYLIDSAPAINATTFAEIDGYFPIVPESVVYTGSNSYHFVEIPLNIGYKQAISRNFEMRTEMGVSYLALLNMRGKKSDATFLRLRDITELNLRTRNIAASISSGIYYNTSRFALGVEPTFSVNLNSMTSSAYQNELDQNVTGNPIQVRPYNCGLNISTDFKLNNK